MCVIKKQWVFTLLVSVLIPLFAIAETNPFTSFRGKCVRGDCFNGEGVMEFPNGDEYHGSFKNGEASGDGVMKFANGNNYYGHWEHNMRDGKGRFTYAIGHEYLGFFRQNHMHGKGRMSFANGDWYEGVHAGESTAMRSKECAQERQQRLVSQQATGSAL